MSQSDFGTIDPGATSGTELAALLNAWRTAVHSQHKGTGRPTYATAGMMWLKDVSTTVWQFFIFDGDSDILLGTLNPTTAIFTPSFGSLSGILRADGSGGVAAATAAQIVALIGTLAVANASHADSADAAGTASLAASANAIADGAVSSAAKIAANIITLNKLARAGTAGQVLYSGGAGTDLYFGAPPAAGVTSVGGNAGAVTNGQLLASIVAALGYTPAGINSNFDWELKSSSIILPNGSSSNIFSNYGMGFYYASLSGGTHGALFFASGLTVSPPNVSTGDFPLSSFSCVQNGFSNASGGTGTFSVYKLRKSA